MGYGTFEKAAAEQRGEGRVSSALYGTYFRAGNSALGLVIFVTSIVVSQILNNGADYWLKIWTSKDRSGEPVAQVRAEEVFCFEVYGCIVVGLLLSSLLKYQLFYRICLNSAQSLHTGLFAAILRAPLRFFEQHSVGKQANHTARSNVLEMKSLIVA